MNKLLEQTKKQLISIYFKKIEILFYEEINKKKDKTKIIQFLSN